MFPVSAVSLTWQDWAKLTILRFYREISVPLTIQQTWSQSLPTGSKKKVQNDMFHVLDFLKDGTALFLFAVIFKCHLFCSQFNIPRLDVSTLLTNTKSFTSGSSSVWTLLHSGAGFITSSCVVRSASEFWNCTLEPTTSGWKCSGLRINYSGLLSLAERHMQGEI